MLDLLAQCIFEATRIAPHSCASTARGWHQPLAATCVDGPGRPQRQIDSHARKRKAFARMHRPGPAFLMPNAWDAGTARILEHLGFKALATTSAGLAFSLGLRDSSASLSRSVVLDNARAIVEATTLPVSADLEDGFGPSPQDCAETIREAAKIGLCGGAIEDATGNAAQPIHDFNLAVERIHAAVEAKPTADFLITARAENFIYDRPDLDDTIRRLQAFEKAGADVVYAPGLPDIETVRTVCASVSVPVNVVVGLSETAYTVDDLSSAGVRRISTGGSLVRAAFGEMIRAARELEEHGTYNYARAAISDADAARHMRTTDRSKTEATHAR
jgi:2-methylisocitrate lyase-like PEP mutase family enzyme